MTNKIQNLESSVQGSRRSQIITATEAWLYDCCAMLRTDQWFLGNLRTLVEGVYDVLLLMGDPYAKIGNENAGLERAMGKHGCCKMNKNEERLVDYCLDFDYVIRGSLFPHKASTN